MLSLIIASLIFLFFAARSDDSKDDHRASPSLSYLISCISYLTSNIYHLVSYLVST